MDILAAQLKDWNEAAELLKKRREKLELVRRKLNSSQPKAIIGQSMKQHALAKIEKELELHKPLIKFFQDNLDELREAKDTVDLYDADTNGTANGIPIGASGPQAARR